MSRTAEEIVAELASMGFNSWRQLERTEHTPEQRRMLERVGELILAARVAEKPIERSARSAGKHADDYLAVAQLNVAITHDGRVVTGRRVEGPAEAIPPMFGALLHEIEKAKRPLAAEAKMAPKDFNALVDKMREEAGEADFRSKALKVPSALPDLPKPEQGPKLITPE